MSTESIKISEIHSDANFNCRGKILPIDVAELMEDIRKHGLIQPVVVCLYSPDEQKQRGFKWKLIAGFRRFFSCQALGMDVIDCSIRPELTPAQALTINLKENLSRQQLDLMQEAKALEKFSNLGFSELDICEELGLSRGFVQIRMMLLKLPAEVQQAVLAGFITQTNVRELYSVKLAEGSDACIKAAHDLKEAKQKGLKKIKIVPKDNELKSKKIRQKEDIFRMQEHIQDNIGNNLATRALAWCAGEINTQEFLVDVKEATKDKGRPYQSYFEGSSGSEVPSAADLAKAQAEKVEKSNLDILGSLK